MKSDIKNKNVILYSHSYELKVEMTGITLRLLGDEDLLKNEKAEGFTKQVNNGKIID